MEGTQTEATLSKFRDILRSCELCPRKCHVDRLAGEIGACGVAAEAVVASAGPHYGQEPPVVGQAGSGTIFFAGCNLGCVFCRNSEISQSAAGRAVSSAQLASMALELQAQGCENINFVSPSHVAHAVAECVVAARARGLTVPVVYNSGGYDAVGVLRLLAGHIDIYMPDFKWADPRASLEYSGVADYPEVATVALKEMYRQVGPLTVDERNVAVRGVLVRHLVMPHDLARSRDVVDIVAQAAPSSAINIMGQYRPAHRASDHPALGATVGEESLRALREYAAGRGLLLVR